jgi:hypothetical protein
MVLAAATAMLDTAASRGGMHVSGLGTGTTTITTVTTRPVRPVVFA